MAEEHAAYPPVPIPMPATYSSSSGKYLCLPRNAVKNLLEGEQVWLSHSGVERESMPNTLTVPSINPF